ncbi:glycosyltransferase family A protein [Pseudanabaena sp. FACHB-2040]|uniref:glycosyltransferase family A protein n=1 Tax=Pseudanabaena sp. FACHB-2040 TaxID=2692859 RepID=UPI001681F1E0|nr:glycosyltransferase family A protein [Pseudanabaena sp. FACHB-2040]MBD2258527.1 glycosyltransferase family 2 protein [Pseudanabaena sp. FACHB-2040]
MQPLLSIVTPTLGNFSDYWLEQLLAVKGDVQFVLVYPPGVARRAIADPRVKSLISPYKGEMMQRFLALLNADGQYVLALDDDDYVHPDVVTPVEAYFAKFPQSLGLRLMQARIPVQDQEAIRQPWGTIPDIAALEVVSRRESDRQTTLQEVPVAPLQRSFDWRYLIWPFTKRTDDHGPHIENFNNKVWRNDKVQQVLPELSKVTVLCGSLTWIPNWGFDRLMGLFLQAAFYQEGTVVGHWMPEPAQVRFMVGDPSQKPPRFHVVSDALLVKGFPQYGYFWNLFFNKLSYVPRIYGKMLRQRGKKHPGA